jgi:DnaJ-class molecular chaperone
MMNNNNFLEMMFNPEIQNIISSPEFTSTVESITQQLFQNLHQVVRSSPLPPPPTTTTNKTKDLTFDLPVSLEELYLGKRKRINLKRKCTTTQNDGSFKITEEKVTFNVDITPGMSTEQPIVFEREADEIPGYERGDVIIHLKEEKHDVFRRCHHDLFVDFDVSVTELYYFDASLVLLDGRIIQFKNNDGDMILKNDGTRKIQGYGMPKDDDEYGDLFIKFHFVPTDLTSFPDYEHLSSLFPPLNKPNTTSSTVPFVLEKLEEEDLFKLNVQELQQEEEEESMTTVTASVSDDDDDL